MALTWSAVHCAARLGHPAPLHDGCSGRQHLQVCIEDACGKKVPTHGPCFLCLVDQPHSDEGAVLCKCSIDLRQHALPCRTLNGKCCAPGRQQASGLHGDLPFSQPVHTSFTEKPCRGSSTLICPVRPSDSVFGVNASSICTEHCHAPLKRCVAGASQSEHFSVVDLTAVSTNWEHPLACQSERVVFSLVCFSGCIS